MTPETVERRIAEVRTTQFRCSVCGAKPGEPCQTKPDSDGKRQLAQEPHKPRENAKENHVAELQRLLAH